MKSINKKDLAYLVYASNDCYTHLQEEIPEGVEVNTQKGTWCFEGKTYKIGDEMRHCNHGSRWGVIGVYDRTNIEHLNAMVNHSEEATKSQGSLLDD